MVKALVLHANWAVHQSVSFKYLKVSVVGVLFFFSLTDLMKVQWGIHLGRRSKHGSGGFSGRRATSQLPTPSGVQISGQRGAGLPSLGWGNHPPGCRFQASQAETRQVLVKQAGAWPVAGLLVTPKTFSWPGRIYTSKPMQEEEGKRINSICFSQYLTRLWEF